MSFLVGFIDGNLAFVIDIGVGETLRSDHHGFVPASLDGVAGVVALAADSANNLDVSTATGANLANVSLGAVGTATYTGTPGM